MSALRRVGLLWIVAALTAGSAFATRAPAAALKTGAFADVPFQSGAGPSVREDDLDGDGHREVILENAHVRLIFVPAMGGVCRSLRLKPAGVELVHAQQSGHGLLRDQLWWPRYSFADRVYFHRSEQTRDAASVEMWTTGVGGMMSFTEIRKRITITRDSESIDVQYQLTNEPSSQTDYDYGFWSHNWLGVPGRAQHLLLPHHPGRALIHPRPIEGQDEQRDLVSQPRPRVDGGPLRPGYGVGRRGALPLPEPLLPPARCPVAGGDA